MMHTISNSSNSTSLPRDGIVVWYTLAVLIAAYTGYRPAGIDSAGRARPCPPPLRGQIGALPALSEPPRHRLWTRAGRILHRSHIRPRLRDLGYSLAPIIGIVAPLIAIHHVCYKWSVY